MYSVLILDDNKPIAAHIQHTIAWEELGCRVVAALHDGISGREAIERFKPDLIITDVEMPGLSGIQMVELARNCIPSSKLIFISAYDKFSYAHQALKLKACDYLLKPFTRSELRSAVDKALAELERDLLSENEENNYSLTMKSILDYLENMVYDSVTLEMVADHFQMSPSKLGRLIQKETNMRYVELVAKMRIRRAKELLAVPYLNISDIAERVGYSDYLTFYKVFVRNEKVSPSEFRKKLSSGED